MHYQSILILAGLASSTLASHSLTSRQTSVCDQQRLTCGAAVGANQSLCASQRAACNACETAYEVYVTSPNSNKSLAASLRNECFAASTVGDGNAVLPIISSLSVAGTTPSSTSAVASSTSSGPATTTTAATTCDQERLTCGSKYLANQSLCAVQKQACDACEAAYESYVTSPGSNKAFAASLRNECFAASKVEGGDGAFQIISTFSRAQAGLATATPTTGPSSSSSVSTTTAGTAQGTTAITLVNPVPTTKTVAPSTTLSTGTTPGNSTAIHAPSPTQFLGSADSLKPIGLVGLFFLGAGMML